MDDFYHVFIIAGILAVQYFLSTRDRVYWGGIIPVAYTVFLTWLLITGEIEKSVVKYILALLLGLLFLLGEWSGGRKHLQEKRKKELDKMKTHDMK